MQTPAIQPSFSFFDAVAVFDAVNDDGGQVHDRQNKVNDLMADDYNRVLMVADGGKGY
jgi:hypothetical protein